MYAVLEVAAGEQMANALAPRSRPNAVTLVSAKGAPTGLIVASPHSGRYYPEEMVAIAQLDRFALRRSEDAFVDLLFAKAPQVGADLMLNNFARAFVDVNRCETELDPLLIDELPFNLSQKLSERVKAGLGVIPRSVGDGVNIYKGPVSLVTARARIDEVYRPWHQAIERQMHIAKTRHGVAVLLDCHSMPDAASGDPRVDIVIGDRFGSSCAPALTNHAISFLRKEGFQVGRNDPFAGGYSTRRHANVQSGFHCLQIEINRSLYMVEGALTQRNGFDAIAASMSGLVSHLAGVTGSLVAPRVYSA
jgi:N-formylglutamate amidohydrolase